MIMADPMHIVCLGLSQHILGNVLFELCYCQNYFAGTIHQRLDALWDRIAMQYHRRRSPSQLANLPLSFFTDEKRPHQGFPCLTTRVKAAETRHLVPIVASIWRDVHNRLSRHDRDVLSLLEALTSFYSALDCLDYVFPPETQRKFQEDIDSMLVDYRALNLEARNSTPPVLRWKETPEFRWLNHVGGQSQYYNPRWGWNYPEESFMQTIKNIGYKCVSGTPITKVMAKIVQKWSWGIAIRMRNQMS